ncbi:type I glutamate--ammonia ligase [Aerococcaceae bacterium DSM 111020]|nr:type I glutamate--ammonia ligase [Aerococcaceae bacterium DSM 111020]
MRDWDKQAIMEDVSEKNVSLVRLMYTDILGNIKNIEILTEQLEKALDGRMTFDGSSMESFVRLEETDMKLLPDFRTWITIEDMQHKNRHLGIIFCDVYTMDDEPYSGDPRSNLKRILNRMSDMGYLSFNIGPEVEFFLFKRDAEGKPILEPTDDGSYYDIVPLNKSEACRRDILLKLKEIGYQVEVSHHEVGRGQHEIDWQYTDAIEAADRIVLFKLIVKMIARGHGLYASFMPKPLNNTPGSGLHCNISLFNEEGNVFYDEKGDRALSTTAYHFLAGLLEFAPAYTPILNPLINSYKRLVDGYEAPLYIGWSEKNRSPFARIPRARGNSTRIELRSMDPAANPYLAFATLLQAGLQGIEEEMVPPAAIRRNVYLLTKEERYQKGIVDLPYNLGDAIEELKRSPVILEALGSEIAESYIAGKQLEYQSYIKCVSQWEIDRYFMSY